MKFKIMLLFLLAFVSCVDAFLPTPQKYRYVDTTSKQTYKIISNLFKDSIQSFIVSNKHPFYQKENDIKTIIIIDTILINPEKNKSIFFVITKNSNDKLLDPGSKNDYHYNAFCFVAFLQNGLWKFSNMGPFFFNNYGDIFKISHDVRDAYFNQLVKRNSNKECNYNMDDVRYWSCPIWEHW